MIFETDSDDLTARRIVAHLGERPEVPTHIADGLANARRLALSRAKREPQSVRLGSVLARRGFSPSKRRFFFGAGLVLMAVAVYCVSLSSPVLRSPANGWDAAEDNGSYVELLQD